MTSWPSQRQVLVPSWPQLSNLTSQPPVQRHLVADTLPAQTLSDNWRRSLVVDPFEQNSTTIIPMVCIIPFSKFVESIAFPMQVILFLRLLIAFINKNCRILSDASIDALCEAFDEVISDFFNHFFQEVREQVLDRFVDRSHQTSGTTLLPPSATSQGWPMGTVVPTQFMLQPQGSQASQSQQSMRRHSSTKQKSVLLTFTTLNYFCMNHGDQRVFIPHL